MASVNAGQASSMLQIADTAMSTVGDVLTRMKVLTTQAASGQVTNTERAMLQQEFTALQKEIERITDTTRFSDQVLLKGEGASAPSTVQRGIKINSGGLQSDVKGTGTDANAGPTATIAIGTTQLATLSTDDKVVIQIQGGAEFDVALAGTETTVADIADTLNSDADFSKVASAYVDTKGNLAIRTLPGATINGDTFANGQLPQIVTARLSYAGITSDATSGGTDTQTIVSVVADHVDNVEAVAQVEALGADTVEVDDVFSVTINGTTVSFTAASTSGSDVSTGLKAAIDGDATLAALVDTTVDSDGHLLVTAKEAGTAFTIVATATDGGGADTQTLGSVAAKQVANVAAVAQVEVVESGSVERGDTFSIDINGTTVEYMASSALASDVSSGLKDAIDADATLAALVDTAVDSSGRLVITAKEAGTAFTFSAAASDGDGLQVPVTVTNGGDIDTSKITQGVRAGDVLRITLQDDSYFDVTISSADVTAAGGSNIGAIFEAITASTATNYVNLVTSSLDASTQKITFVNSAADALNFTKVSYFVGGVTQSIGTKTGVTDTALKQGVGTIDLSGVKLAAGDTLKFDTVDATGAITEQSYTIVSGDVTGGIDALIKNLNADATFATAGPELRFERDGANGIRFSSTIEATDSAGTERGVYNIRNVRYEVDNDNQNAASWVDMDFGGRTFADGDTINFTVAGEKRSLTLDQTTTGLSVDDIVDYINAQTSNGQVGEDVTASNVEGMLRLESSGATVKFTEASFTGVDGSVLSGNGGSVAGSKGGAVFEVTFQIGAYTSASDQLTVQIQNVGTEALGVSENDANILTADAATNALTSVNEAINRIQDARATIGAQQNRLDYAMQALGTQADNMEAARSNLMDLDVAAEMSAFTSKSILQQAGVSMLAQANQMPRNLLRLFQ